MALDRNHHLMNKLYNWLQKNHPDNIPIPLKPGSKNPVYKHKNKQWSWDDVKKTKFENFGVLLKTIVCLDFDNQDLATQYEERFPILQQVPCEITKKGKHYLFKRTDMCDAMCIYDRARFMGIDGDDIDIKTVCSTGTAGVLCVAPSPNKKWIRPPWKHDMPELSGDLLKFIVDNWDRKHAVKRQGKKYYAEKIDPPTLPNPQVIDKKDRAFYDECIDLLAPNRSEAYDTWSRAGWCMRNISGNNEEYVDSMKDKWLDFSMKCSEKYDESESMYMWDNIVPRSGNNALGIGTLMMWAKEDDANKYNELRIRYHGYDAVKKTFEETHAKIRSPLSFVRIVGDSVNILSRKELIELYENLKYEILNNTEKSRGVIKENFVKRWLRDENIKVYEKMEVLPPPMECKRDVFNLWNGFEIEKHNIYEEQSLRLYLDHLSYICNGDQHCIDYYLDYMAHIIQFPGRPIGIALAFVSEQGKGKNLLLDFMLHILTDNLAGQTGDPEKDVFDRFSNAVSNKLMLIINEAKGRDGYKYSDRLKDAITAPKIRFEEKGKKPTSINNYARFVFTSNNRYILNVEHDDRRFVMIETTGDKRNEQYYIDLATYIEDRDNQRNFYDYLKARQIDESKLRFDRPKTEIYNDLRALNLPLMIKYFLNKYENLANNVVIKLTATEFLKDFKHFVKKDEEISDYKISSTKFGLEIKKYLVINNGFIERKRENNGSSYLYNTDDLGSWLINHSYTVKCLL